jgi:hypothetical protein
MDLPAYGVTELTYEEACAAGGSGCWIEWVPDPYTGVLVPTVVCDD